MPTKHQRRAQFHQTDPFLKKIRLDVIFFIFSNIKNIQKNLFIYLISFNRYVY